LTPARKNLRFDESYCVNILKCFLLSSIWDIQCDCYFKKKKKKWN
jgi:hypothetical protein